MTRVLPLAVALLSAACANVQDLGQTPPAGEPHPAAAQPSSMAAPVPIKVSPSPELGACPNGAPADGAACAGDVGWCHYRTDPARGIATDCACGVNQRWTCLLVRDDDRNNRLPAAEMPYTASSCMEGAPCAEGLRCTVWGASPRVCSCTSAGILLCNRPAQ